MWYYCPGRCSRPIGMKKLSYKHTGASSHQGSPHVVLSGRCAQTKFSKYQMRPDIKCSAWTKSSCARTKHFAPGQNISKNTSRRTQTTVQCTVSPTYLFVYHKARFILPSKANAKRILLTQHSVRTPFPFVICHAERSCMNFAQFENNAGMVCAI